MKYNDLDKYQGYIFELDNVVYPEKDYLFQVYYLFANLIEYLELYDAKTITDLMVDTYKKEGEPKVFDRVKERFAIDEKYRDSLAQLMITAKLPLKLLVYEAVLKIFQDIVVDRKKIILVTNGSPALQLNKIKQTEWHGLEAYLTCYFAEETLPMPEPDVLHLLLKEHNLERREVVMIGNSDEATLAAQACGIDYYNINSILGDG